MIFSNNRSARCLAALSVTVGLGLASCKKSLTINPGLSGQELSQTYYQDSTQCYSALAAAYSAVRVNAGGFYNQIATMNSGSDECYAGGGGATDGGGLQNFSNYTLNSTTVGDNTNGPGYLWYNYYIGITNANVLLDNIANANMSDALKTRMTAECQTLRAYYYFNLVRIWGNIPLLLHSVTTANLNSVTQSDPADVYKQIEADLTAAIPNLPAFITSTDLGRITQGAATALLGKVYLYEGDGLPGAKNPDGSDALDGDKTKYALAASTLAKVNGTLNGTTFSSPYGYQLLSHFADLWSNKIGNASPLFGNAPGRFNSESIFEDVHTNQVMMSWSGAYYSGTDLSNMMETMVSPRGYALNTSIANNPAPDLSTQGAWSFNPITTACYNFMQSNMTGSDSRLSASIFNMNYYYYNGPDGPIDTVADQDHKTAYAIYNPGAGYQNTGYFLYKFMPLVSDQSTLGGDAVLNFQQDTYIIRLADTYLMEAEALIKSGGDASRAMALVNAVRARAGATLLTSAPTLQQIYNERRLELVGEGHRWFDLVRTGQAATVLASRGFTAGKNELFPIPYREMTNQNFKQNYGYTQ